ERHGQATTLSAAEPLKHEIGVAQGRLRRARGELLALQRRRARAEADARAAAQRPHHERLLQLADDEVPAAATAFRDALAALIEKGTMLANAFTAVRTEGTAAGYPRGGELGPDDPAGFTAFVAIGGLYTLSPLVVDARRLHTTAALDRAVLA